MDTIRQKLIKTIIQLSGDEFENTDSFLELAMESEEQAKENATLIAKIKLEFLALQILTLKI
jgi:hypothetical protein